MLDESEKICVGTRSVCSKTEKKKKKHKKPQTKNQNKSSAKDARVRDCTRTRQKSSRRSRQSCKSVDWRSSSSSEGPPGKKRSSSRPSPQEQHAILNCCSLLLLSFFPSATSAPFLVLVLVAVLFQILLSKVHGPQALVERNEIVRI